MGALSLPSSGSVYLDANCFIYSVERVEPYRALLEPIWVAAPVRQFTVLTSELAWLETLARPLRDGNTRLERLFRGLLTSSDVTMIPATLPVWEEAARIRGFGLKTPDAVHAATALRAGCALFLTNDPGFRRVPGLPVQVLDAVLAA